MRTSSAVLAIPALASAQQFPFIDQVKDWFNAATASISSAIPSAPSSISIPDPVASGAAKIAEANVDHLTISNYVELLKPGAATANPGIEDWMIFVTGANKTCFGACERADKAFNEATALIVGGSRSPPHLAVIDCDSEGVLCHAWAVSPPQIVYIQLPQPLPDQSTPATTVRNLGLNRTTVTAPEIAAIHLKEEYKEKEPYEGFWHPFDGPLAKSGLQVPVGYAIWGFSKIPSWAFMIGVSFLSRTMMSRRMQPGGNAGARPAGGAPAS